MHKGNLLDRKTIILICLVLLQVFIVFENGMVGFMWQYLSERPPTETMRAIVLVSLVAGVLVGFTAIYLVIEIVRLSRKERELDISRARLDENRALVDVLRSNRHDFFNHLQVILGYIQLKKSQMAVEYMKEITEKLEYQTSISNIKDMGVAALLLKKENIAESQGIKLEVAIQTDLYDLNVPSTELTRIIGNLIDNALDAVSSLPVISPVRVNIRKTGDCFKICVFNREPIIPPEIRNRIFDKGFTTKGENGSGLGLFIVTELTKENGGSVELISNQTHGTEFIVTFPAATVSLM